MGQAELTSAAPARQVYKKAAQVFRHNQVLLLIYQLNILLIFTFAFILLWVVVSVMLGGTRPSCSSDLAAYSLRLRCV